MPVQYKGEICTYLGGKVAKDRLFPAQDITPLDPTPGLSLVAVQPFGPDTRRQSVETFCSLVGERKKHMCIERVTSTSESE